MIVVMKSGATKEQIQHVIDLVREFGLKDHPIYGTDRTAIDAAQQINHHAFTAMMKRARRATAGSRIRLADRRGGA